MQQPFAPSMFGYDPTRCNPHQLQLSQQALTLCMKTGNPDLTQQCVSSWDSEMSRVFEGVHAGKCVHEGGLYTTMAGCIKLKLCNTASNTLAVTQICSINTAHSTQSSGGTIYTHVSKTCMYRDCWTS